MAERRFQVGTRVEIHPGCDLWMQGARFGTITGRTGDGRIRVRMDHPQVKKAQLFWPDRLQPQCYGARIYTYGDFT